MPLDGVFSASSRIFDFPHFNLFRLFSLFRHSAQHNKLHPTALLLFNVYHIRLNSDYRLPHTDNSSLFTFHSSLFFLSAFSDIIHNPANVNSPLTARIKNPNV